MGSTATQTVPGLQLDKDLPTGPEGTKEKSSISKGLSKFKTSWSSSSKKGPAVMVNESGDRTLRKNSTSNAVSMWPIIYTQ
jgi:hypothetical protein